jgi:hypothetical protein
MKYEKFVSITKRLKKDSDKIMEAMKIDVDVIDLHEPKEKIIKDLLIEIYGEKGYNMYAWFCYENDFGLNGKEIYDENKNRICYSLKSLWEYLEINKILLLIKN